MRRQGARLLVAPLDPTNRVAIVQTFALFGCGALIVRRTRTQAIGWLLIVPGVTFNLLYAASQTIGGAAPTGWIRFASPLSQLGITSLALLVLVFPSGRLESRLVRVGAWVAVVGQFAAFVLEFLYVSGVAWISPEAGFNLVLVGFIAVVVIGLVDHVRRYRRRPRVEQLQLKWFLVAIAGQFIFVFMAAAGIQPGSIAFAVGDNLATTLFPVTILIAISRYRLYEIDRIVSRTVAYAAVVATLALLGIGGVVVVTSLLPAQDRLAVALSTVAVVALFDPLRRRVIDLVDRRFDRTRYVARKVVENFGRDVQDITDVAEISDQVHAVVSRTVAPTTVAVWRPPDAPQPR